MRFDVVIAPTAEGDLDALAKFIALDNPDAALRFVAELRGRLAALSTMPRRCPRAPEGDLPGLEVRHLIHRSYRIIFGIDASTVVILRVRHGALPPGHGDR